MAENVFLFPSFLFSFVMLRILNDIPDARLDLHWKTTKFDTGKPQVYNTREKY